MRRIFFFASISISLCFMSTLLNWFANLLPTLGNYQNSDTTWFIKLAWQMFIELNNRQVYLFCQTFALLVHNCLIKSCKRLFATWLPDNSTYNYPCQLAIKLLLFFIKTSTTLFWGWKGWSFVFVCFVFCEGGGFSPFFFFIFLAFSNINCIESLLHTEYDGLIIDLQLLEIWQYNYRAHAPLVSLILSDPPAGMTQSGQRSGWRLQWTFHHRSEADVALRTARESTLKICITGWPINEEKPLAGPKNT